VHTHVHAQVHMRALWPSHGILVHALQRRRHVLSYTPASGQIFGFSQGGTGLLSSVLGLSFAGSPAHKSGTPVPMFAPWSASEGEDASAKKKKKKRQSSGGDNNKFANEPIMKLATPTPSATTTVSATAATSAASSKMHSPRADPLPALSAIAAPAAVEPATAAAAQGAIKMPSTPTWHGLTKEKKRFSKSPAVRQVNVASAATPAKGPLKASGMLSLALPLSPDS